RELFISSRGLHILPPATSSRRRRASSVQFAAQVGIGSRITLPGCPHLSERGGMTYVRQVVLVDGAVRRVDSLDLAACGICPGAAGCRAHTAEQGSRIAAAAPR